MRTFISTRVISAEKYRKVDAAKSPFVRCIFVTDERTGRTTRHSRFAPGMAPLAWAHERGLELFRVGQLTQQNMPALQRRLKALAEITKRMGAALDATRVLLTKAHNGTDGEHLQVHVEDAELASGLMIQAENAVEALKKDLGP